MAAKSDAPVRLKCIYGNKVTLLNTLTNQSAVYELVTFNEEKLKENKISNYTHLGKAIWAKHEGDEAVVKVPGQNPETYRILKIENA